LYIFNVKHDIFIGVIVSLTLIYLCMYGNIFILSCQELIAIKKCIE